MPIIAKAVMDARRAAAAAAAVQNQMSAVAEPSPAGIELEPKPDGREPARRESEQLLAAKPAKRRGHAVKDDNGKWQPTSDYPEGFARPPVRTQFKPGCKGGPGRPKGSVSHNALFAKHLSNKRHVTHNGKRRQMMDREILIMTTIKSAMEGKDKQARNLVLAQAQRLFPEKDNGADASVPALTASDLLSLAEYEEELREQLRAELRAEIDREKEERK